MQIICKLNTMMKKRTKQICCCRHNSKANVTDRIKQIYKLTILLALWIHACIRAILDYYFGAMYLNIRANDSNWNVVYFEQSFVWRKSYIIHRHRHPCTFHLTNLFLLKRQGENVIQRNHWIYLIHSLFVIELATTTKNWKIYIPDYIRFVEYWARRCCGRSNTYFRG